jgi:hypothetical protein
MDESKPRRRWLRFGIRDLLWAMVVAGLVIGWWMDHLAVRRQAKFEAGIHKAEIRRARAVERWLDAQYPKWNRDFYYDAPMGFFGD